MPIQTCEMGCVKELIRKSCAEEMARMTEPGGLYNTGLFHVVISE